MGEPQRPGGSGDGAVLEVACQEFVELVTEHLEGALPPAVERAVVEHLALCDPCVQYLAQVRATTAALAQLPPPTLPEPVRDRLLDLFARLHPPTAGP